MERGSFIVEGFDGRKVVTDQESLLTALAYRDANDSNAFWLYGREPFPTIYMLVRGQLAVLHYFRADDDPGYRSKRGNLLPDLDPQGQSVFYQTEVSKEEIWNDMVIPIDTALNVARDFFVSRSLPKSIEWEDLAAH